MPNNGEVIDIKLYLTIHEGDVVLFTCKNFPIKIYREVKEYDDIYDHLMDVYFSVKEYLSKAKELPSIIDFELSEGLKKKLGV